MPYRVSHPPLTCGGDWLRIAISSQADGQGLSEVCCAEHLDDAFEVVNHDADADFGLRTRQASQQRSRMTEDAVFDYSEGMFDRGLPQSHRCWGGMRFSTSSSIKRETHCWYPFLKLRFCLVMGHNLIWTSSCAHPRQHQ